VGGGGLWREELGFPPVSLEEGDAGVRSSLCLTMVDCYHGNLCLLLTGLLIPDNDKNMPHKMKLRKY
jgi:hypothetical protein